MKLDELSMRECCFKTFPKEGRKLVWEITHRCYFECPYCFQAHKRQQNPTRILHPSDLSVIIKKLPALEIKDVLLTGGEIRWAKESLPDICAQLQKEGLSFSLSTSFFDNNFVDYLLDLSPRALNISLDPRGSETEEKYERHVGKIEDALRKCQKCNIDVKVTGVLTRESLLNTNSYMVLLEKLTVDFPILKAIYLTNPYDIGYLKSNVRPQEESLRKWLAALNISATLHDKIKLVNFHRFNAPLQQCPAGAKLIHIEPDGNVYPCHLFANLPKETFLQGNIINDPAVDLKRRLDDFALRTKEALAEYKENTVCEKCEGKSACGGGCVAELVSIGQLVEPQLVCKKIKQPTRVPLFEPNPQSFLPFESSDDLPQNEEKKIVEYINQNMKTGHDLAHGYDHVKCVVAYSRYIAMREGANLRVVTAAAYFHDFEPRRKLIYESHTAYSAQRAVAFLKTLDFKDTELNEIYHCIITSSYGASELGCHPLSLEAKCVRDADWLDAIGARGIARVFAFGAAHGCEELGEVEWSLDPPPKKRMSLIGPDPSPIYHFFSKLLWVKDGMVTNTGKLLAEVRHKRMLGFLKEYGEEMSICKEMLGQQATDVDDIDI